MGRKKKNKPSAPRKVVMTPEAIAANDDGDLIANDEPRVKDGPSARILRQMLRQAHAPAPVEPAPVFRWTTAQITRIRRAEQKIASDDPRTQAKGVADMARLHAERAAWIERAEREAHEAETLALAKGRGEEIDSPPKKPGEPAKPMLRRSGLEWLWKKGRLTPEQQIAGQRYADDYRKAEDISLRSCIANSVGGGDAGSMQEARHEAFLRLRSARQSGLHSHERMIGICNQVCGEGKTIRAIAGDNEAEAQQTEAVLLVALDLLHAHYRDGAKCDLATST
jgi:hypothetical protein